MKDPIYPSTMTIQQIMEVMPKCQCPGCYRAIPAGTSRCVPCLERICEKFGRHGYQQGAES